MKMARTRKRDSSDNSGAFLEGLAQELMFIGAVGVMVILGSWWFGFINEEQLGAYFLAIVGLKWGSLILVGVVAAMWVCLRWIRRLLK
jgi:hypothetical protein